MLKRTAILIALLSAMLSVSALAEDDSYPPVKYGKGAKAAQIKRGEYLAKASDCVACHSDIGGKPFAGGLPINTPFGAFYAPNITPDRETGIGNWTEAEFIRVMKKGIRKDGSHSFPVFPYLYYSRMTVQDIKDIYAYMHAVPAVHKQNRKHDVPFPFNVRLGQIVWKFLFFHPERDAIKPDPKKSALWNRGQYLAEGPGHCAMCHTPINLMGAPKRELPYTGNTVDGYYAPNITGDSLQGQSVQDLVKVFKYNKTADGKVAVHGPMAQVVRDSLRHMTGEDLLAIATYLKSLKSAVAIAGSGAPADKIYGSFCSGCHTAGSGGAPRLGDVSQWDERLAAGKGQVYAHAVHGYNSMPVKGNCVACTDVDIKHVVDWMLAQTDQGGGGSFKPRRKGTKAPKKLTLVDGQRIYNQSCASCHTAGTQVAPKVGDRAAWAPHIKKGMDVLFERTINGWDGKHVLGGCKTCTHAEVMAAVKYMVQNSAQPGKDYRLW